MNMKYTIISRKLMAFLLSFLLLISLFPMMLLHASAEAEVIMVADEVALSAQELLAGLDMLEAPLEATTTMTRGNFAKLLADMVRYNGFVTSQSNYRDVTASTANVAEISFVIEQGYMSGKNGLFFPNEGITYADATRAFVEMTGNNMQKRLTTNSDYMMKASGLGICKSIDSKNGNAYLSAGAAYKLAANTLTAKSIKMAAIEGGYVSDVSTGNFLEVMHDIKRVTGILTKTRYAGIYSASGTGKNTIELDEIRFYAEEDWTEFLGCQVTAYIDYSGVDAKVLHLIPIVDNTSIKLKSEDIISVNNDKTEIIYNLGEEDDKAMSLTTHTTVVWNGSYGGTLANFTKEQLSLKDESGNPKTGYIRLIDHDGDEVCDVIIAMSYEIYYTASADHRSEWLTDANRVDASKTFKMSDYSANARNITYESGSEASFDLINKEQIVQIAESLDKKKITAIIGETEVEVNITKVRTVGGVEEYYSDGVWYRGNSYFCKYYQGSALCPTVGWHGYFKLDIDGRISVLEYDSDAYWGYLIAIGSEPGLSTQTQAKLFSNCNTAQEEYKVIVLDFADRVQVNPGTGVVTTCKEDKVKDLTVFKNGTSFRDQLIRFTVNNSNEINKIITADTSRSWGYSQFTSGSAVSDMWYGNHSNFALCYDAEYDGGALTADNTLKLSRPSSDYSDAMLLGGRISLNMNRVPFWVIPSDLNDEKGYAYSTYKSWSVDSAPNFKIYDLNNEDGASAIVWKKPSGIVQTAKWEAYKTLLITETRQILNDEGVVTTEITGYRRYQYSNESMGKKTFIAVDPTLLDDVQIGDLVQYDVDTMGRITHIRWLFDYDKLGTEDETDLTNDSYPGLRRRPPAVGASSESTGYDSVYWGKLIYNTPLAVVMSFESPNDTTVVYGNNANAFAKMNWFQWLVVDTKTNEVWTETSPTSIHTLLDVEDPDDATDVLLWSSHTDKVSMGVVYLK